MPRTIIGSSITGRILLYLLEAGEELVNEVILAPVNVSKMYAAAARRRSNLAAGRQALYRLKRLKYVGSSGTMRKSKYYLTPAGKHLAQTIRARVLSSIAVPHESWDGKWRIVCFDIPEIRRDQRDFWRAFLKHSGFKKYQDSVWVSPYNVLNEVVLAAKEAGLSKYLRTIIATNIDDSDLFKRLFDL